jgi:hypothetical protein
MIPEVALAMLACTGAGRIGCGRAFGGWLDAWSRLD